MKKITYLLLAVVGLSLSLALVGCGGGDEDMKTPPAKAPAGTNAPDMK